MTGGGGSGAHAGGGGGKGFSAGSSGGFASRPIGSRPGGIGIRPSRPVASGMPSGVAPGGPTGGVLKLATPASGGGGGGIVKMPVPQIIKMPVPGAGGGGGGIVKMLVPGAGGGGGGSIVAMPVPDTGGGGGIKMPAPGASAGGGGGISAPKPGGMGPASSRSSAGVGVPVGLQQPGSGRQAFEEEDFSRLPSPCHWPSQVPCWLTALAAGAVVGWFLF